MPQYQTLLYEEQNGVARVTLNRPDVHNAFNAQMQRELHEVWRGLRRNDDVRVAVLTGAGDKAFCTGIDRTETMAEPPTGERVVGAASAPFMFDDPGANIGPKSCDLGKPVIAAASAPPLAIQGAVRAIWAARELSRSQALSLGYAFVGLGTNPESIRQGQAAFAAGKRVKWKLR